MTLGAMEFLRRILSHVLPDGLHKVRYFGWLHPRAKKRRSKVQTLLEVPILLTHPEPPDPPLPFDSAQGRWPYDSAQGRWHLRCPHCGAHALQIVGRLPRAFDSAQATRHRPP